MEGSSKQPSSDVTAMDNPSGNSSDNNGHLSSTNSQTASDHDTESTNVTAPMSVTSFNDGSYCTAGPSSNEKLPTIKAIDVHDNKRIHNSNINSMTAPPSPTGCGCMPVGIPVIDNDQITLSITPTTGGLFDVTVERNETIDNLKKILSKRLKLAKERICLLHREK